MVFKEIADAMEKSFTGEKNLHLSLAEYLLEEAEADGKQESVPMIARCLRCALMDGEDVAELTARLVNLSEKAGANGGT